jgi:hypothetical protein
MRGAVAGIDRHSVLNRGVEGRGSAAVQARRQFAFGNAALETLPQGCVAAPTLIRKRFPGWSASTSAPAVTML